MATVHVFVSTGHFRSFEDMRSYVDPMYTEDGDAIPSAFMREVDLGGYEPMCLECVHRPAPAPIRDLLVGVSYGEDWLSKLPADRHGDAAVCAFPPNRPDRPEGCSLEYLGAFDYPEP